MKKILAILAILILGVVAFYVYSTPQISQSPPQKITFENLPTILSQSTLVTRFPSDTSLSLRFYKDSPEQTEHSYIVTKNSVTLGSSDNVDIVISMPSKYMDDLTTGNLCDIITKARKSGELTIQTDLSTTQLGLKFLALLPEKGCFGF